MRHLWGSDFNDFFEKGETVLNLASQEFSVMLDQDRYHWVDFEFYEYDPNKANRLKKHSTISKKGRGKMVAFLASNQIKNLTDIKKFDADGYQFESNYSNDKKFVFIKQRS